MLIPARSVFAALLGLGAAVAGGAQRPLVRSSTNIDAGWSYLQRSTSNVRALDTIPASEWSRVDLPHTWNRFDPTDPVPGYRRDASWYRRTLDLRALPPLRAQPAGARIVLRFECANTVADIYVNGTHAGRHVGGYVGFETDITPYVRRDGHDRIDVRVDNSDDLDLIPSDKSDFVIYGGLTRDVWLDIRPAQSISRVAVTTPVVRADSAQTRLTVTLRNADRGAAELRAVVLGPRGEEVARSAPALVAAGDSVAVIALPTVRAPALWSPASPSLYRAQVTLRVGDAVVDRVTETFGYRFYSFEPNGPFYLNGARLLLRGTHRHEEAAGYGAAMPNELHRRDMEQIKAMGANFVRLAHYPQDPEIYRAADSLGLLLWDELPWDRAGLGGPAWQANTRRLLVEQIHQNMNHPSIVLWSLGNEVADVIDPAYDGKTADIAAFMRALDTLAHALDPYRPTATRKFDAGFQSVDVYSPSTWAGWYSGVYRNYEASLAASHAKFPRMFHAEYGADAHYGRHTETPITGDGMKLDTGTTERVGQRVNNIAREGDWSESYQTDLLEWHLQVANRTPWLTGNAQWAMRDFATPLRPTDPIPYVNQKGLFTRDNIPKDAYYLYRSYWTTSPRFAYIVSHTWTERAGARGVAREVRVFSNCTRVELSNNGQPLGERARDSTSFPAQGLRWNVAFAEGQNRLLARCTATSDGGASDSLTVHYTFQLAGKPDHILVEHRALANGHELVEATIVDAAGRRVLDASDRLYFSMDGDGRLLADYGTPTGSSVIEAANGRAAIEMMPPAAGKTATITVRTQDINGTRLVMTGAQVKHVP